MELDTGQWLVIILCAVLIIAYIRGYLYNRQQGEQTTRWLLEGLKAWGEVRPGEKMPGMVTGGRLIVEQGRAPLRKIEALYILAPRENPLFWLFHRLQGRGDELYVWITYFSKPEYEVELARKGDRQFGSRLKATDKPALTFVDAPTNLQMAYEMKDGADLSDRVGDFVQRYRTALVRLALRGNKPHLFVRIDLHAARSRPAVEFFNGLGELRT